MKCTWEGCRRTACHEQIGQDKKVWADLCTVHHEELEEALGNPKPYAMMSAYVKAQGGSKAAADRHLKGLKSSPAYQQFMDLLFPKKKK